MILLSNESELVSSNEKKIILTNQRIHMTDKEWGNTYSITMFLEDISSIERRYNSNMLFLVLGIVAALFSFYFYEFDVDKAAERFSLIAMIFFVLYWITRKNIVSITSHGGKSMNFETAGLPEQEIQKFLKNVQEAKLQRMDQLRNMSSSHI
jgi:hypothetical protein